MTQYFSAGFLRLRKLSENSKNRLLILFFYICSHGLVALSLEGIWWDDWVLFNNSRENIYEIFRKTGSFPPFVAPLHMFLSNLGPYSYRLITFVCFYICSLAFYELVKIYLGLTYREALIYAIIFTTLPFNVARIAAIDLPYTISLTLFLIAWLSYPRSRIISLTLFFISFLTQSLLLFMLPVFISEVLRVKKFSSIRFILFRKSELLLIPILYWIIKKRFFAPSGNYEGYNQNISPLNAIKPTREMLLDLTQLNINIPSLLVFSFFSFFILSKIYQESESLVNRKRIIVIGTILLIIGILPYLLLGLSPRFIEWHSRHQLLMPLGVSLILGGIVNIFHKSRLIILALVIGFNLSFLSDSYTSLNADWEKQEALVSLFAGAEFDRSCSVVVIEDETGVPNAIQREIRFYEWNAILKLATGKNNRFVLAPSEVQDFNNGIFDKYFTDEYSAGNFVRNDNNLLCELDLLRNEGKYSINFQAKT